MHDFNKSVTDKQKTISSLEKQIAALEGDNSLENRKKLQELKSQLADAKEDLDDYMYDRSISDQEKALDKLVDDNSDAISEYLKDTDKVLADAEAKTNQSSETVAATIEKTATEVGYEIQTNISDAWTTAGDSVKLYSDTFTQESSGIITVIGNIKTAWDEANKSADAYGKTQCAVTKTDYSTYPNGGSGDGTGDGTKTTTSGNSGDAKENNGGLSLLGTVSNFIAKNKQKAQNKKSYYYSLNQYIYDKTGGYVLSKANETKLAELLGVTLSGVTTGDQWKTDTAKILKKLKAAGFSTGGIIDASLINSTGEDGFALVKHKEAIITEEQWKSIRSLGDSLAKVNMQQFTPYIPDIQAKEISPVYNIDSSITVDGIATNEIVKDMAKVATKQAENVIANINRKTYAKGVRV